MTTTWRAEDVARIRSERGSSAPTITEADVAPIVPGWDVWDVGPVRTPDGAVAIVGGMELWLVLSAPATGDPGRRHDIARLRLVGQGDGGWRDLGPLFPPGASVGSREWAGSAVYDASHRVLDVLYTAVGGHDGDRPHFAQRIAATSARVSEADGTVFVGDWTPHKVVLSADGQVYQSTDSEDGEPGFIKAFRDPFPFRDPADGRDWALFTASAATATSTFNGAIGLAEVDDGRYRLADPLITADGVNNELERPHVVVRGGHYYLFFSTQRRTFAPGRDAPTGLYGFVAPALAGPYEPINGSGVVLRNPDDEPFQAYSWLVLPDLTVASFVDFHSMRGRTAEELAAEGPDVLRDHFGGTIAPLLRIALDGATATVVTS